jgi:hypothetical protein
MPKIDGPHVINRPEMSCLYLVIGCGYFGSRAVERLHRKDPRSKIIVVDKNEEAFNRISHVPVETVTGDVLSYLNTFFTEGRSANYIVPAVPFHLAFEFILSQLEPLGARRKKIPPLSRMANPVLGKDGDLYTSLAGFRCPEDCPEPARYCTVTKEEREKPLYNILADLKGRFESKVLRSRQLGPGMGGFRYMDLLELVRDLRENKRSRRLIVISTASRCHAVTSGLSI